MAEYLISQSADMYETNLSGETSMMICAKEGFIDIAKALLKKGYDLNKTVKTTNQSVLGLAVWGNKCEMVHFLLESGANVNITDNLNWTPLMMASYSGYVDIVQELLRHNADVSVTNKKGMTALDLAIFYNHSEIVELLDSKNK